MPTSLLRGRHALLPWLVSACSLLALAALGMHPTGERQLAAMLAIVITLGCLMFYTGRAMFKWKALRFAGLLAPAVLALGPVIGGMLAAPLRAAQFAYDLPRYNQAAAWAAAQAVPDQEIMLAPPPIYADLGYAISVRRNAHCGIVVDFVWAGAFPVKHVLRRYTDAPARQADRQCQTQFFSVHQRTSNWFELSD